MEFGPTHRCQDMRRLRPSVKPERERVSARLDIVVYNCIHNSIFGKIYTHTGQNQNLNLFHLHAIFQVCVYLKGKYCLDLAATTTIFLFSVHWNVIDKNDLNEVQILFALHWGHFCQWHFNVHWIQGLRKLLLLLPILNNILPYKISQSALNIWSIENLDLLPAASKNCKNE